MGPAQQSTLPGRQVARSNGVVVGRRRRGAGQQTTSPGRQVGRGYGGGVSGVVGWQRSNPPPRETGGEGRDRAKARDRGGVVLASLAG